MSIFEKILEIEEFSIKLIPLIETTESIISLEKILAVTKRINGVHLGAEDLSREREVPRRKDGSDIDFVRNQLALIARAYKIDCIDTPYTDIRDTDGLTLDAQKAKNIGFTGKTCIHPSHVSVVNDVFSPTENDVDESFALFDAYKKALLEQKGAFSYKGKMVDKPIAEQARRICEKAIKIQNKEDRYKLKEEINNYGNKNND